MDLFSIENCPDRASWLARRKTGLGSTDAVTLMDERLGHDTAYSLWARKSGLTLEDDNLSGDTRVRFGNLLEPAVLKWWCEESGRQAERRPFRIFRRKDKPHLISSPDAVVWFDREGVECKTTDWKFRDDWDRGVPLKHAVQAQHQMLVTGWARWHVAVLIGGNDPRAFVVDRDEEFIALLEQRADTLWRRVLDGDPPALSGRDPEGGALRALFPAEKPGSRVKLGATGMTLHEMMQRGLKYAAIGDAMKTQADIRLREMMGDAEIGELPDGSEYHLKTESKKAHTKVVPEWSGRVLRHKDPKKKRRGA